MPALRVIESFPIPGRGLVVLVDGVTGVDPRAPHAAVLRAPDGGLRAVIAWREWTHRVPPDPVSLDGFLLVGLARGDAPPGSELCVAGEAG